MLFLTVQLLCVPLETLRWDHTTANVMETERQVISKPLCGEVSRAGKIEVKGFTVCLKTKLRAVVVPYT